MMDSLKSIEKTPDKHMGHCQGFMVPVIAKKTYRAILKNVIDNSGLVDFMFETPEMTFGNIVAKETDWENCCAKKK